MNLPTYDFLSAPLWLITVLHIVTLTLHFLAMNFMVGGIVIILFGKLNDKWNNPVIQKLIKLFPTAMAATVSFGVAPLLFIQLVYPKQIYSASIINAWFWLWIVGIAIISYYFLYGAAFTKKMALGRSSVYLALALIGFLYISFVYSSTLSMGERPDIYKALYARVQSGIALNPDIGSYIFRWMHMLLGALVVGAYFVGWLGKDDERVFKIGKTFYLWSMIIAMLLGLVYLFTLKAILVAFMHSAAIWFLFLAFILSLVSLYFYSKKKFCTTGILMVISLLSMVSIRHIVRLIHLEGIFNPATTPMKAQWSIFIVFLICFLFAVGIIWYMLTLFFTKQQQAA